MQYTLQQVHPFALCHIAHIVTMYSSIYQQGGMVYHPQETLKPDIVSNPRYAIDKVYLPMVN